eukprot:3094562-Pyramimonas_sp.AAC.1
MPEGRIGPLPTRYHIVIMAVITRIRRVFKGCDNNMITSDSRYQGCLITRMCRTSCYQRYQAA